jgi:DNA-directed RNA polymerase subunit RPC12/RpoP
LAPASFRWENIPVDFEQLQSCPYCAKTLSRAPQRKSKCPYCSHVIYVRSAKGGGKKRLLTEEEVLSMPRGRKPKPDISEYGSDIPQAPTISSSYDAYLNRRHRYLRRKYGNLVDENDIGKTLIYIILHAAVALAAFMIWLATKRH